MEAHITAYHVWLSCTSDEALHSAQQAPAPQGINETDLEELVDNASAVVKLSGVPPTMLLEGAHPRTPLETCAALCNPALPTPVPLRHPTIKDMSLFVEGVYIWKGAFRKDKPGAFQPVCLGDLLAVYMAFTGMCPVTDEAGMIPLQ